MSFDTFVNAMLLLIFAAFLVERSLAVIFESDIYIAKWGGKRFVKPVVAVVYATVFVAIVGVNLVALITSDPEAGSADLGFDWSDGLNIAKSLLIIVFTGIFVAGGSKASLKFFRDVMNIKSSAETRRQQSAVTVPAVPGKSAGDAAKGDNSARQLSYDMLDNYKSLTN
jgi:hypothetical protein